MSVVCPNGHASESVDYCDTCGAPIPEGAMAPPSGAPPEPAPAPGAAPAPPAPTPDEPAAGHECPNCGTAASPDALFCEACGYDFTTGAMPRSATAGGTAGATAASSTIPPAIALDWVAEVWVDPEWYADQEAEDPCPSPGLPVIVPLEVQSALIGRLSASRNIHPEIDCSTDTGVSRRHAQLTTDGSRWFVEDLQSSNGTYVGPAAGPLPGSPIDVGPKTELKDDDRLYVGAWTRIVVRRATDEERAAAG